MTSLGILARSSEVGGLRQQACAQLKLHSGQAARKGHWQFDFGWGRCELKTTIPLHLPIPISQYLPRCNASQPKYNPLLMAPSSNIASATTIPPCARFQPRLEACVAATAVAAARFRLRKLLAAEAAGSQERSPHAKAVYAPEEFDVLVRPSADLAASRWHTV